MVGGDSSLELCPSDVFGASSTVLAFLGLRAQAQLQFRVICSISGQRPRSVGTPSFPSIYLSASMYHALLGPRTPGSEKLLQTLLSWRLQYSWENVIFT